MRTLTRHLDRALEIYADIITNPAFPEKEFERLRVQRADRAAGNSATDPNTIAGIVFQTVLYGRNHPYGHPLTGDETRSTRLTGEDVRKFYETFYRPNNSALIVVGDVTPDAVVAKLEKAFAGWKERARAGGGRVGRARRARPARRSTSSTVPARPSRSSRSARSACRARTPTTSRSSS